MNIKKTIKNYILKPIVYAGLVASVVSCGCGPSKEDIHKQHLSVELARKCMDRAAGSDGIMSFEESAKMIEGLGYEGAIFPREKIDLKSSIQVQWSNDNPRGILYIGFDRVSDGGFMGGISTVYRDKVGITLEQMQNYLNSQNNP